MRRFLSRAALGVVLVLLVAAHANARPGGGHSFSGGSHGSSSHSGGGFSGGGGDGGLVAFLFDLVIEAPGIGIPVVVVIVVVYVVVIRKNAAQKWEYTTTAAPPTLPTAPTGGEEEGLEGLKKLDPEFSEVLFEDFCYALYAQAHKARVDAGALSLLAPYLSAEAREHLQGREPAGVPVEEVVIGEMRVTEVTVPTGPDTYAVVTVEFVANLGLSGAPSQYVRESWRLARAGSAVTRPWKGTRTFNCPGCGAPFEASAENRCASCGNAVDDARFDWLTGAISLLESQELLASMLTGTTEERGTDLPTVFQPGCPERWAALMRDDPALSLEGLEARLRLIYAELERAWEALDLRTARPFISDALFNSLQYWINAYRAQGLKNVNEGATLTRWKMAKVERDKHYDAVTLRIWGTGCDYTLDTKSGKVVSGNRKTPRPYSEYWTLIRGAGVRGAPKFDKTCPGCGAPLKVSMTGNCEYCNVLVTSGDFDWVLSRIEQDDSYGG